MSSRIALLVWVVKLSQMSTRGPPSCWCAASSSLAYSVSVKPLRLSPSRTPVHPEDQTGPLACLDGDQGGKRDAAVVPAGHRDHRGPAAAPPGTALRGPQALPGLVFEDQPRALLRDVFFDGPRRFPPGGDRRHRFAELRDTRNRLATSVSVAPASISSAASSRTRSRRARSAAISPPPSACLMTPAYNEPAASASSRNLSR